MWVRAGTRVRVRMRNSAIGRARVPECDEGGREGGRQEGREGEERKIERVRVGVRVRLTV